jgi:hypothetical protein
MASLLDENLSVENPEGSLPVCVLVLAGTPATLLGVIERRSEIAAVELLITGGAKLLE